jgi:hypothetical protein
LFIWESIGVRKGPQRGYHIATNLQPGYQQQLIIILQHFSLYSSDLLFSRLRFFWEGKIGLERMKDHGRFQLVFLDSLSKRKIQGPDVSAFVSSRA